MVWALPPRRVESRTIYTRAKGHGGEYVYFFCRRRQERVCSTKYIDEDTIESAMFDVYGGLHFPSDLQNVFVRMSGRSWPKNRRPSNC